MNPTIELFRQDAYLQSCSAQLLRVERSEGGQPLGLVLDQTVFYPIGGGQAGDAGVITLKTGAGDVTFPIGNTQKAKNADGQPTGEVLHLLIPDFGTLSNIHGISLLSILNELEAQTGGVVGTASIDWARRHRLMRFHTSTHLLCHLVPALVNGCSITPDYVRLDFAMTDPLDKDLLTQGLARLVAQQWPVTVGSISDAQLDADPSIVKSMSVSPPRGSGNVRTIRIGATDGANDSSQSIDFQPCGGTHVANTAEIGAVVVTKIEKKSATTRRVVLGFA